MQIFNMKLTVSVFDIFASSKPTPLRSKIHYGVYQHAKTMLPTRIVSTAELVPSCILFTAFSFSHSDFCQRTLPRYIAKIWVPCYAARELLVRPVYSSQMVRRLEGKNAQMEMWCLDCGLLDFFLYCLDGNGCIKKRNPISISVLPER